MDTKTTVKLLIQLLKAREVVETMITKAPKKAIRDALVKHLAWMDQKVTDLQVTIHGPNWEV